MHCVGQGAAILAYGGARVTPAVSAPLEEDKVKTRLRSSLGKLLHAAMFDTGDWNDTADAQHLSKSIHHHWKSSPGVQEQVAAPGTERKISRKRLLETLRLLEAASHSCQADEGPLPAQDVSKCEDGEAEAMVTCSKHKKRKKRPGAVASEVPLKKRKSSVERSELHVTRPEENGGRGAGTAQDGPGKGTAVTAQTRGTRSEEEPVHLLSRKKWKNKQKNKKRNKNKFKATPESKGLHLLTKPESAEKKAAGALKNSTLCLKSSSSSRGDKGADLQDKNAISRKGPKLSRLKKVLEQENSTDASAAAEQSVDTRAAGTQESVPMERTDHSTSLRSKMEERLKAARFRYINQQLYTCSSREAQRLFQQDPEAFQIYHRGFSTQLQRWPKNPTDEIIKYLRNRPASLVVADFGCGECKIARSVRNTVHSFDLVALNDHVTVCDMAKVPLRDESVDIAVFCLALMGTNLREFFEEANRVLKPGGILKVAEVASRFEDIRPFISALANLGFKNISKDTSNSFFYTFDFLKTGPVRSKGKLPGLQLKACLYKKR